MWRVKKAILQKPLQDIAFFEKTVTKYRIFWKKTVTKGDLFQNTVEDAKDLKKTVKIVGYFNKPLQTDRQFQKSVKK